MATKIRGTMDDRSQMILGQVRKVFNPRWIHKTANHIFIGFDDGTSAEDELCNFMNMHGYELSEINDKAGWDDYIFE